MKYYMVGGAVRDFYRGVKPKDIDFAVEAESYDAMRAWIIGTGATIFLETPQYVTIRANHPVHGGVDYVLCRKDGVYSDGRRPDEVTPGSIFDDLARRDLTANAIALPQHEQGAPIDPHGGIKDIQSKVLRCVGSTARLDEDRLRVLRVYRFAATFGWDIHHSIREHVEEIEGRILVGVSADRIKDELMKIARTDDGINQMFYTRVGRKLLNEAMQVGVWLKPTMEAK